MEYGYDSIDAIMLMKDVDVDAVLPSNKGVIDSIITWYCRFK